MLDADGAIRNKSWLGVYAAGLALASWLALREGGRVPTGLFAIPGFDLIAHFGLNSALAMCAALAFAGGRARLAGLLVLVIQSSCVEALQHFVPLRQPLLADIGANLAGIVIGAWLMQIYLKKRAP